MVASDSYNKPASPARLRYIAILSSELGIPEPTIKTNAEAGRMISELKAEKEHRRRVNSGVLTKEIYNLLATTGHSMHYQDIAAEIARQRPNLGITAPKALATLRSRRELFTDTGGYFYFLKGKDEGRPYPII